jgi:hypothetical protein
VKLFTRIEGNLILDHNFKDGEYTIDVVKKRNAKHIAKYWVLCEFFAFNCSELMKLETKEDVHSFLKQRLGTKIYTPEGVFSHVKEFSIEFSSMDQDTFNRYYSRVLDVIALEMGCASEEIINELVNFF